MTIPKEIEPLKRSAWKPVVVESDGLPSDSKFARTPFIKSGEEYPFCQNCDD